MVFYKYSSLACYIPVGRLPLKHKVHIYIEYHNVFPLVGIGTLPPPLSPASVPFPPVPKGEGTHLPAGEVLGESQFQRLEKKLTTLLTLCPQTYIHIISL